MNIATPSEPTRPQNQSAQGDLIVHLHIPKNGGQTFNAILDRWLEGAFLRIYFAAPNHPFLSPQEIDTLLTQHPHVRAIASHKIRYPCPERPNLRYQYVTFLRDPLERIVSLYFYEKHVHARGNPAHRASKSLSSFVHEVWNSSEFRRWQCHHLHPSGRVEEAKEVLRKCTLVGVVERYGESLALAHRTLGMPLGAMLFPPQNVSKHFGARHYLGPALYRRMRREEFEDVELYRFANQLLDERLRHFKRSGRVALGVLGLIHQSYRQYYLWTSYWTAKSRAWLQRAQNILATPRQ